jgi:hypothetical protein
LSESKYLEKIPTTFREQFLQLFSAPPPETIYPDLYQQLIDEGTDKILEELVKYNERRKELAKKCRDKITVEKAEFNENLFMKTRLVGADAGGNGVDFRCTYIPLYAAVAIVAEGGEVKDDPICKPCEPDIWPEETRPKERESLLSFKLQFEIAREAVEKWKPQLCVIDGAILLHPGLRPGESSTVDYEKDYWACISSAINLLETCFNSDIPLIGFVKRSRMNTLSEELGVPRMRDTALLNLILKPGEYTRAELKPMKSETALNYERKAEELGLPSKVIRSITNIHSIYMRTGFSTPFKLEIPNYCLDRIPEATSILYTSSEEDGVPFVIREADELARISATVSNIRTLMLFSKALDLVKEGAMNPEDLDLLTLQIGEAWVLYEAKFWETLAKEAGK